MTEEFDWTPYSHEHDSETTIECERCSSTFCARCINDEFDEWLQYGGIHGLCQIPSDTCPLTLAYEARRAIRTGEQEC